MSAVEIASKTLTTAGLIALALILFVMFAEEDLLGQQTSMSTRQAMIIIAVLASAFGIWFL